MKTILIKLFATVSLIITLTVAGPTLAGAAAPNVVAWGSDGEIDVPADLTNIAQVVASGCWLVGIQDLALRADGTVVVWGSATNVPAGLTNVVAVAGGYRHCLAMLGDGPPVVQASLNHPMMSANGFSASLPTQSGRVYALEYKVSLADTAWTPLPLVAGTGHERTLTDPTATGMQRFYRVRRW